MIHPHDEQSLHRLLGVQIIPDEVQAEYELRLRMFHSDGNTGPLRTLALIDMIRFLGYRPKIAEPAKDKIDWRKYPHDGTTRVEARFFGHWMPGVFLGFVDAGSLAIRLDDDPVVKECRPDIVRLATDVDEYADLRDEGPDARISLLEKLPEMPPTGIAPPADEPDEGDTDLDDEPAPSAASDYDWSKAKPASPVWIDDYGNDLDGQFVRLNEDGMVVAVVDGKERAFDPSKVIYAGD